MLREALIHDTERLHDVRLRAIRTCWKSWYTEGQVEEWCRQLRDDYYAETIQAGVDGVFVALDGGTVAGFVHVDWREPRLRALYVDPEYGRRGHAARLLRRVEQDLVTRQPVRLRLVSSLPSERFYLERGYRRVRRYTHRLPSGVMLPSVLMTKRFSTTASRTGNCEA